MAGSSSRQFIEALAQADFARALEVAADISVSKVTQLLTDEVAPDYPEACDRFIEAWLRRLSPHERLAAASATMDLYLLELVWLPRAEDRSLQRVLEAAAASLLELRHTFGSFSTVAESPDASFDVGFMKELRDIGDGEFVSLAERLSAKSQHLNSD